jgi:hypothetical protein
MKDPKQNPGQAAAAVAIVVGLIAGGAVIRDEIVRNVNTQEQKHDR